MSLGSQTHGTHGVNECESVQLVAYEERMTAGGNIVSHHQTYR